MLKGTKTHYNITQDTGDPDRSVDAGCNHCQEDISGWDEAVMIFTKNSTKYEYYCRKTRDQQHELEDSRIGKTLQLHSLLDSIQLKF